MPALRYIAMLAIAVFTIAAVLIGIDSKSNAVESYAQEPPLYNPPNIVVFVADDAGWSDFGAYGNKIVQTPNIDRLAASGLKVENAFLTSSQCSPSRISILTGKYPHVTKTEDLHVPLPENEAIVPIYLQQQGYFTGNMRKQHYGPNGARQFNWYARETAEAFPDFLDAAGEQPFFLWVGFTDPHRPYQKDSFDPAHDPAQVTVPPFLADTPETRADLALYYDEIARMDANIGYFINELESRGLRDNTLVIFLSDNGMPFPRAKATVYDVGIRMPLMFSWPAEISAGTTYESLVSAIDLAPTLLDVAGVEPPLNMQGRSIRAMFTDPQAPGRNYIFSERNWHNCDEHIRSVRTARYKLIRNAYTYLPLCTPSDASRSPSWFSLIRLKKEGALTPEQARLFEVPRAGIEFYDLEWDPGEFNNVADESAYQDVVEELAAVLDRWIDTTGDFPPFMRRRDDNTDRITGVYFSRKIPPMWNEQ